MNRLTIVSITLGLCAGAACGGGGESKAPSAQIEQAKAPAKPERPKLDFSGTVSGTVKLAAGTTLPMTPPVTAFGGSAPISAPPCPPVGERERRTIAAAKDSGGLSPVHLAITQMSAAPPLVARTHEVLIEDCRLTPTLVGGAVGDTIRVVNKSSTPFLPVLPGDGAVMQAMVSGQSREFTLGALGPTEIKCAFGAYCGQTLVISVGHPLFAVTDAQGNFKIEHVPLDQDLMLHAWHPLFQVTSVPLRLAKASAQKTVELGLTPQPAPPEEPAPSKQTVPAPSPKAKSKPEAPVPQL